MPISDNILNVNKKSYQNTPLFLGEKTGLLDSINKSHPELFKIYKDMKQRDWDEQEHSFASCNTDFKTSSKSVYDMMIRTLAWQWEADSVAAHNTLAIMAPFVSNTELWLALTEITKNECLTGDHEVLTPTGWKRIDEVTTDDKVAQWDYISHGISFVNPQQVFSKHYEGTMYHFYDYNNNLSQIVTPNHRMPVVYPYWSGSQQKPFKLAEHAHYHGGNGLPTAGFIWSSGRHMTAQERLYVAVQADGALCGTKYTGSNTGHLHYRFGFSKQRKIDRLFQLCAAANWKIQEINYTSNRDNVRHFYVYVPLQEYNWQAKTFDWFKLDEICQEWAMDFLDELQYWDGNVTTNERTRYISTNKACIDKVAAVAHLVGHRGHVTTIPPKMNVVMPTGNLSNTKEAYQLYLSDRPYIAGNSIVKTAIEYSGMVHCLTVPTGYFMVRHNGAISVTGNCLHGLTYSEIVRGSFDNPDEVLQEILSIQASFKRLEIVAAIFEKAYNTSHKYALGEVGNTQETYNDIFMMMCALLVLERIQFMASFAITFAICDTGIFAPIGVNVQKICQDELDIHVRFDKYVIRSELQTERGKIAFQQLKPQIQELIDSVTLHEIDWTMNDLFSEGRELIGVEAKDVCDWVKLCSKDVYDVFGLTAPFAMPTKHNLTYLKRWIDMGASQASPQEQRNSAYLLGGFVDDLGEEIIDF